MKLPLLAALTLLPLAACDRQPGGSPAVTDIQPPKVNQAPVETLPYEDGFTTGMALGRSAAKPRAELPARDSIEALAAEKAAQDTRRTEKWQRGFADGYLDGYRQIAQGLK